MDKLCNINTKTLVNFARQETGLFLQGYIEQNRISVRELSAILNEKKETVNTLLKSNNSIGEDYFMTPVVNKLIRLLMLESL